MEKIGKKRQRGLNVNFVNRQLWGVSMWYEYVKNVKLKNTLYKIPLYINSPRHAAGFTIYKNDILGLWIEDCGLWVKMG